MGTLKRIWCVLFHSGAHVYQPGGMHCYEVRCDKCHRVWLRFE